MMDSLLPDDEVENLEQTPLEERATALEAVERRLRSFMDDGSPANDHDPRE